MFGVKVGVRTPYAASAVEAASCVAGAPRSGEAGTQLATLRGWDEKHHLLSNLPSRSITVQEGQKRGAWTVHPVKG
jgi:hypothetical protein